MRADTNRRNREEADPFARYDSAKRQISQNEPRPPLFENGSFLSSFENPTKRKVASAEGREKYEWIIQQDMMRLFKTSAEMFTRELRDWIT